MADVELVIKIPEEAYKTCLKLKGELDEDNSILGICLINSVANCTPLPKGQGKLIERVLNAVETLKQEPKVGHWKEKEHYFEKCWAECSVCGKTASGHSKDTGWGFTYSYTDYCPNCGAKMESEAADL